MPDVAYAVTDDAFEGSVVVFASSPSQAKSRVRHHPILDDCEYIDLKATRAKAFDGLVGKTITPQDYLDRGWYWHCSECECMCHGDDNPLVNGNVVTCRKCAAGVISDNLLDTTLAKMELVLVQRRLDQENDDA